MAGACDLHEKSAVAGCSGEKCPRVSQGRHRHAATRSVWPMGMERVSSLAMKPMITGHEWGQNRVEGFDSGSVMTGTVVCRISHQCGPCANTADQSNLCSQITQPLRVPPQRYIYQKKPYKESFLLIVSTS